MKKTAPKSAPVRISAEDLVMRDINELIPYANNAKVHTPEQVTKIRSSLREFGFVSPVLIDETGNIIAGHGRVLAARAEGMPTIPCVVVSNLTEAQRKAYILADNRLAELAEWDPEALNIELQGLNDLHFSIEDIGLSAADFAEITVAEHQRKAASLPSDGVEEATAEEDDYDGEVPEACPHKKGDVFRLGRHLLVCGDCTSSDSVQAFAGGGTR